MTGTKIALLYGVPAAVVVAIIEAGVAVATNAPVPTGEVLGGGAAGGAIVGAAAWAMYKTKVDQQGEELKKKADADAVAGIEKRLDALHTDVREIRALLTTRLQ
mgnify:CR=1 FL=1